MYPPKALTIYSRPYQMWPSNDDDDDEGNLMRIMFEKMMTSAVGAPREWETT